MTVGLGSVGAGVGPDGPLYQGRDGLGPHGGESFGDFDGGLKTLGCLSLPPAPTQPKAGLILAKRQSKAINTFEAMSILWIAGYLTMHSLEFNQ